jgi:hypothetical protein
MTDKHHKKHPNQEAKAKAKNQDPIKWGKIVRGSLHDWLFAIIEAKR